MKCPECGYENKDDVLHCNMCHKVLGQQPEWERRANYLKQREAPKSGKHGALVKIFIIIAIGITAFLYNRTQTLNKKNFSRALINNFSEYNLPVLVNIEAVWCRDSVKFSSLINEFEQDYKGRLVVYKVDIDKKRKFARNHKIDLIPTILFFRDGAVIDRINGADVCPEEDIREMIEKIISFPGGDQN